MRSLEESQNAGTLPTVRVATIQMESVNGKVTSINSSMRLKCIKDSGKFGESKVVGGRRS
jgi:hypothetical protein